MARQVASSCADGRDHERSLELLDSEIAITLQSDVTLPVTLWRQDLRLQRRHSGHRRGRAGGIFAALRLTGASSRSRTSLGKFYR